MTTIKEDYVSFETAKLLKEKGFDCETDMYYSPEGELKCWIPNGLKSWLDNKGNETWWWKCIAPSQPMAMEWLRNVHSVYYDIQLLLGDKAEKYGDLQLGVYQLSSSGSYVWKRWIYADTYRNLYENFIKYCLRNLI